MIQEKNAYLNFSFLLSVRPDQIDCSFNGFPCMPKIGNILFEDAGGLVFF
jgi:hypothetical protein